MSANVAPNQAPVPDTDRRRVGEAWGLESPFLPVHSITITIMIMITITIKIKWPS